MKTNQAILALKSAGASSEQISAAIHAMVDKTQTPPQGYKRVGTVAEYVSQVIGGVR